MIKRTKCNEERPRTFGKCRKSPYDKYLRVSPKMLNSVYSQTQVNALAVALTWTLREQPFHGNSYGGRYGYRSPRYCKNWTIWTKLWTAKEKRWNYFKIFTQLQIISCLETIVDGACIVDDLSDLSYTYSRIFMSLKSMLEWLIWPLKCIRNIK